MDRFQQSRREGLSSLATTGVCLRLVITLLLAAVLTSCSTFTYDWRQAAKKPIPTNDITGLWEGRWLSDVNAHNGRLRCILTQREDGRFNARFRATYMRVLKFGYTAVLDSTPSNGVVQLDGSADLGRLWGSYDCEGHATPTNFFARYRSRFDHGTFRMARPAE